MVNLIIDACSPQGFSPKMEGPFRSFGLPSNGVSFSGDGYRTFVVSMADLYGADKDIQATVSKKAFESKFIEFFKTDLKSKRPVDEKKTKAFFNELSSLQKQRFSVLRELFGATIDGGPVVLGPFTIYRFSEHQHLIDSKMHSDLEEFIWIPSAPAYVIEVSVTARSSEKALELADAMFARFESTMRFVIGSSSEIWEVGVLRFSGLRYHQSWAFAEDGSVQANASSKGAWNPLNLSDPYFIAANTWHSKIWEFLSDPRPTELQRRILLAVDWLGQAHGESSRAVAFLKGAIALEIVFTHSEKTIINASILSQISESIALLIATEAGERRDVESRMKKLYAQRSAIAHSGDSDVSERDLVELMMVGRSVIKRLITSHNLLAIKTVQELYDHMKSVKYSCGKI